MNRAPFPSATGPSLLGAHFYTPGWSPPPPRAPKEPKPQTAQKRDVDVEALKAYRATGATLRECGARFGIGRDAVKSRLDEPAGARIKKATFDQQKALDLYLDGYSLRAIEEKIGSSRHTIGRYLRALDLPEETRHAALLKANARVQALQEKSRPARVPVDVEALVSMRMDGATIDQCARKFGISNYVASGYLKGIRPPLKPVKRQVDPVGQSYHLVVTDEQRAAIKRMGGAPWLRSLIDAQMKQEKGLV